MGIGSARWYGPHLGLAFNVDVAGVDPTAGEPSGSTQYGIYRATFFQTDPAPQIDTANGYPALHAPTFKPKNSTYERWYVANIGNAQDWAKDTVDMHPFHMHLVNFVVQRRWTVDATGNFVASAARGSLISTEFLGTIRFASSRTNFSNCWSTSRKGSLATMSITAIWWNTKIWG